MAEMISLLEYLSWQRQEPASLMAGRRMERAPCEEQKVLEVGTRRPLWNQHVSTRLARWLELHRNKSGSFSTTGLGGLMVTVRKNKWQRGKLRSQGDCPFSPSFVPQAALSLELRAQSRKLCASRRHLPVL